MRVDAANREITCKVVYYGPGMSGKTTNLKQIHERAPARAVGELVTLDTHSERTLHFDLLPMDLGQVRGHQVRLEFYTVPGQSYYASTRRLVLDGADGIVFVADSRREALDENIDSMNDLLDNLRHLKLPEDLPVVMQYNKQDLPSALKPEHLDPLLNSRRWPSHTAIATGGVGVIETMKAITALVLEQVKQLPAGSSSGQTPAVPPAGPAVWLITCYRCQNMLETQGAKRGDLYTCGACRMPLEIVDLEHGVTRAPQAQHAAQAAQAQPGAASGLKPATSRYVPVPAPREDSGAYSLQAMDVGSGSALNIGSGPHGVELPLGAAAFELDGYDMVALLDENVQGRRFRVKERTTRGRFRALALNPTLMRQPGYASQVETYARMASQVRHQNLLPLHSLHQGREAPIVLSAEPVDHESLAHVLARRRTLAPPHALQIARQIALGLEEASRQGIVHGWLRPDIILVNANSDVLVDEIGVAKHHRYLVRELSGASAATEYYLAPEHLSEDARSDIRSDMFMLGALLFRMLTGEGLVTGYTAHEALHKVAATGCRTARSAQPNLSRDLDGFIQRLVSTERKDRPQTWREVIDLCDRFGGGAKRQTFKLTQGHQPGSGSSRASVRAPESGHISRAHRNPSGTTTMRVGTGPHVRNPGSGSVSAARQAARQEKGGGFGILVAVLVVLALVGALVYAANSSRQPPVANEAPGDARPAPMPLLGRFKPESEPSPLTDDLPAGPQARPTSPTAGPNRRLPSTLQPAPTAPGAAPAAPLAQPAAPTVQIGDEAYSELLLKIADAERASRFGEALALCERLPPEARALRVADVEAHHQARRSEIEKKVRAAATLEEARGTLDLATKTWGMPGDAEWAAQVMQLAGNDAAPSPGAATTTKTAGGPATAEAPAKPVSVAEANWQVEQALVRANLLAAEQAAASIGDASPEVAAVKRKIEVWKTRAQVLGEAIAQRKPLLRITNPTDGAQWDVTGAEDGGLQVASSAGSRTRFTWNQVAAKDLARICAEAAGSAKAPVPREHALAVVMLTLSGDTALATVQLKQSRAAMDADLARDLETGISLHKQYETIDLLARADEAARAGNQKGLGELLDQLRKPDRAAIPEVAAELPRLEEALKRGVEGRDEPTAGALRDRLTFDALGDLQSLPLRDGEWTVNSGQLTCTSSNGSVGRKDLANGRSLNLSFQTSANRGAFTVSFRGVRVLLDLSGRSITASTREQEAKKDFPFIVRSMHTLYIEVRGDHQALVEINNGVESFDLRLSKPGNELTLAVDTSAAVQIDDLAIVRETKLDPVADAKRIAEVRATGFEPIGQATLVPPAIVLPASALRSGIALARRETVTSMTIEAKGTGKLEVRFGKIGEGGGQVATLDLGKSSAEAVKYTVGWANGVITVRRGDIDGEVFFEDKLQGDPPHVLLMATQEATLLSPPKLNRQ
jgi:signal recognition particle receptor subunit beta